MPDIVSKNPEIVIAMLNKLGMKCATGAKPKILIKCPEKQLCTLNNGEGEFCIYSPDQINTSTQMNSLDFIHYADFIVPAVALVFMIFLVGIFAGLKLGKR